jgi:hypothetical protein
MIDESLPATTTRVDDDLAAAADRPPAEVVAVKALAAVAAMAMTARVSFMFSL